MKKIAMILSGCGYKEGTEVTEAVTAITCLSKLGAQIDFFAPIEVLKESDRISRDKTKDLKELHSNNYDALVLPGGFGAAKVLSTWATEGAECQLNRSLNRIIEDFHRDSSPIGALCISPALVARALGEHGVAVTIGNDKETAEEIEKTGAQHVDCEVTDFITDRENKVVTCPAYMYEASPGEVATGIEKAMTELYEMA